MIAPFWSDVDTRHSYDGYVWYKTTPNDQFVVVWEEVARYKGDSTNPLRNTFQVVLSGASYTNRHICFCYGRMEWAQAPDEDSTDINEAHVGIAGGPDATFNLAQFSNTGSNWGGIGSSGNGVGYLKDKSFCFDSSAIDTPPDEEDLTREETNERPTAPIEFNGNRCHDYDPDDSSWNALERNDDNGYLISDIGIQFPWLGENKHSLYINTNGILSFDGEIGSYQPEGFDSSSRNMIAPFWSDVDTRHRNDGYVWYKTTPNDQFVVVWEEVARFGANRNNPLGSNTFQVVLSGASYANRHICFCYGDMEWVLGNETTTGQSQVGIAGGPDATFNLAQFSNTGSNWGGIGSSGNGVGYLKDKSFCFDSSAIDTPPDEEDLTREETNERPTVPIEFNGNRCYDYDPDDSGWNALERNDDNGYLISDIGIQFPWLGENKHSLYINTNGILSFDGEIGSYQPEGFDSSSRNMIAPFWSDVDTRHRNDGYVWYKTTPNDQFVVVWEEVARFGANRNNPLGSNTFQVVLSGASYANRHICFCYGDMEWVLGNETTTGQSQVGIAGGPDATFNLAQFSNTGSNWGGIGSSGNGVGYLKDKSFCFDSSAVDTPPDEEDLTRPEANPGPGGDPHITTWIGEHFEYHGQCDLTLVKDKDFAGGLGLDIQIRTKVVRFWSYIKNAAIKIGNDILEIEGSPDANDVEAYYYVNFEYQGELDTFAGFPVTQKLPSVYKRQYIIDLSSKYPGQEIVIELHKEFVRVRFNGNGKAFRNTVGLMGDYKTGKTLARDGTTVMDDFTEFGDEWQVLPSEPKIFHEISHPQFPELCIKPEDPRGERKRRLSESNISIEQAEMACASLKDPLSMKDCVYDVLATQDMDMVGAF